MGIGGRVTLIVVVAVLVLSPFLFHRWMSRPILETSTSSWSLLGSIVPQTDIFEEWVTGVASSDLKYIAWVSRKRLFGRDTYARVKHIENDVLGNERETRLLLLSSESEAEVRVWWKDQRTLVVQYDPSRTSIVHDAPWGDLRFKYMGLLVHHC